MINTLVNEGIMANGYGIIAKKVMRDKDLSIEAKAIYAYLSSYSGAGNTAYPSISLMCGDLNIGEERFYRHRKQLLEKGYIVISKQRNDKGFENNVYTLPLRPYPDFASTGGASTGIACTGNKGTNNNSLNNNSLNNNSLKTSAEWFNTFWDNYPRKVAKGQALKTFEKQVKDKETLDLIITDLEKRKGFEQWTKDNGQFIPYPSTYLNGLQWHDEYEITLTAENDDRDYGAMKTQKVEKKIYTEEEKKKLQKKAADLQARYGKK